MLSLADMATESKPQKLDDLVGEMPRVAAGMSGGGLAVARMLAEAEPDADDVSDDDSGHDEAGDGDDEGPSMYEQMMAQGLAQKRAEAMAKREAEKAASKTAFGGGSISSAAEATGDAKMTSKERRPRSSGFKSGFLFRGSGKSKPKPPVAAPAAPAAVANASEATEVRPPSASSGSGSSTAEVLEVGSGGGFDLARAVTVSGSPTGARGAREETGAPVLPGVRAAMTGGAASAARLSSDKSWLTDDLTRRIASDPALALGFAHPRCQAAIADLQKDPAAAQRKYASDPLVTDFLKRFTAVMGDHFSRLGAREEAAPKPQAAAAPTIGPEELARMARESESQAVGRLFATPWWCPCCGAPLLFCPVVLADCVGPLRCPNVLGHCVGLSCCSSQRRSRRTTPRCGAH